LGWGLRMGLGSRNRAGEWYWGWGVEKGLELIVLDYLFITI
jgi:hypothetical protein